MAGLFKTLLRGMLGVTASVLLVGMVWTLYIQRASVAGFAAPIVGLFTGSGDGQTPNSSDGHLPDTSDGHLPDAPPPGGPGSAAATDR